MKSLKKGFTLVELMVVIVIIGILAALAIPRFMGATNKTKATEFKPVLKQIYTLEEAYRQENPTGNYAELRDVGWDVPGLDATQTSTKAYFNYAFGNAGIGPTVADQLAEVAIANATPAGGIAVAQGNALATATPNINGVQINDPSGRPLRNGVDNVCVLTTGGMNGVAATADRILALAGSTVDRGPCP